MSQAKVETGQEEEVLAELRAEVDGMCNCCANNRPILSRMRVLLGMAADDPEEA